MIFTHNFGNGKERTIFMSYNLRTDIKNTLGFFSSMHTVFVCVVSQQWKESKYVILPSAKTSQVAWRAFLLLVWLWAPWWQISALSKGSRCDSGQDSMLVILKSNLFFFSFSFQPFLCATGCQIQVVALLKESPSPSDEIFSQFVPWKYHGYFLISSFP